jgi:hypothetical protein
VDLADRDAAVVDGDPSRLQLIEDAGGLQVHAHAHLLGHQQAAGDASQAGERQVDHAPQNGCRADELAAAQIDVKVVEREARGPRVAVGRHLAGVLKLLRRTDIQRPRHGRPETRESVTRGQGVRVQRSGRDRSPYDVTGRNTGRLTSGVTSSKVTSTGMSMTIASGATPLTVDRMRAPSGSSTTTTA